MTESEPAAMLKVLLLGPPLIERDGVSVSPDTRKAIALLAYLAGTGEAHSREALAALFWPEYDQERAYANLRRTLWSLNKAVGNDWVEAGPERVSLNRAPGFWLDVDAFRRHLAEREAHGHAASSACPACLPPLTAAAALYRDDFMAGFTLRDSPAFDDWQFFQAEGLRRELATALERLAQIHSSQGEFELAIGHARRWLGLDPLNEAAHRELMSLYAWAGQRTAALRQYQECLRILGDELGIPPEDETARLYEAIRAGQVPLPSRQSSLRAREPIQAHPRTAEEPAPAIHLPVQPTPFVGRDEELGEIAGLLGNPDCRLLTLVGPGGIGKTRLAIQAAARQTQAFPNGVYFVPLAPLSSPEFLVPAIADALHFTFFQRKDEDPRQQLLNYLREKRLLLLLDNFEHLVQGAGQLADILCEGRAVKLLVTSRERLNLREEWVLGVGGMRFPESGDAESLQEYSAIRLFLQATRHIDVGFSLSAQDLPDLVRLCQRVDGMPLGLELAAAWVKVLSCREIVDEIERSIDFLTTSARNMPERHRSLRAVFDHSWQLLAEPERRLFRRLSVFRGGFRREAAEAVAGASLPLLAALVDKSLLRPGPLGRYDMHQVLREYAAQKLVESPSDETATRDRHSAYFTSFLQDRESQLLGANQKQALDEIVDEIENVRTAWHWAVGRCRVADMARAMGSLHRFYNVQSRFQEGEELFGQAAAALAARDGQRDSETVAAQGLALSYQSWFANRLYRHKEAAELARRSLAVLQPLGSCREKALANQMAIAVHLVDDPAEMERLLEESASALQDAGDRSGMAITFLLRSEVARYQLVDIPEARRWLQEGLRLFEEIGDRWGMAYAVFDLGELAQTLGDRREAAEYYRQSLDIRRGIGDRWGVALCLDYMGFVARELGEYDEARRLHEESLAVSREIGDRLGIAGSIDNLGLVARDREEFDEARELLEEGLSIRAAVGRPGDMANSTLHLADLALTLGEYQEAACCYQSALELSGRIDWFSAMGLARRGLGEVAMAMGDFDGAKRHFLTALELFIQSQDASLCLDILVSAGQLLATVGQAEQAAKLIVFARHHSACQQQTQDRADRLIADLASRVPASTMAAAAEQAESKSLEKLVSEVLTGQLNC